MNVSTLYWPPIQAIVRGLESSTDRSSLPAGVKARQLARRDVPQLIERIEAWYPTLAIAEDRAFLTGTFYENEVALEGEEQLVESHPTYVLLLDSEQGMVAFIALTYESVRDALLGQMAIVDPRARGLRLGRALIDAEVVIARELGVALTYGLVDIDQRAQIAALEGGGFMLCGFLPNSDSKLVAPYVTRAVHEAIYVRPLVPPESLIWPDEETLQPTTAALMNILFGAVPDRKSAPRPSRSGARPALDSRTAVHLKAPVGSWPEVSELATVLSLPAGYAVTTLAAKDVATLIARLLAWYPQLAGSLRERLLNPSCYDEHFTLADAGTQIETHPGLAVTCLHDGEIVGALFLTADLQSSTLYVDGLFIDPTHRRRGLASVLLAASGHLGHAIGTDLVLLSCPLSHPYLQRAAERAGWNLIGVIPAAERELVAPGTIKYRFEALYALQSLGQVAREERAGMAPRMTALLDFVLGQ